MLFALAGSRPLLLLASALLATGAALAYPALMALAVRSVPRAERTEAIATVTACFDAGFAAASLGLAVALDLAGFAAVFGSAAAVTALGALAVWRGPLRERGAVTDMTRTSVYASSPSRPCSTPTPLCLTPPNGWCGEMSPWELTYAAPHSSRSATASARSASAPHTEPQSPNGVALARATASSTSS